MVNGLCLFSLIDTPTKTGIVAASVHFTFSSTEISNRFQNSRRNGSLTSIPLLSPDAYWQYCIPHHVEPGRLMYHTDHVCLFV